LPSLTTKIEGAGARARTIQVLAFSNPVWFGIDVKLF